MWFWKWKMTLAAALSPVGGGEIGRVMGEGEGCESQELINAQRTVLTMERGGPDLRTAAGFGNSLSGGRGNGPPG